MSEHFWGRIRIGGRLKAEDAARFAGTIPVPVNDIPTHIDEHGIFVWEDDEAVWGKFEQLETLCCELDLPYIRESDGLGEYTPEIVFRIPGMDEPHHVRTDTLGDMIVPMHVLQSIRDSFLRERYDEVTWLIDRHVVELPDLPTFEIG